MQVPLPKSAYQVILIHLAFHARMPDGAYRSSYHIFGWINSWWLATSERRGSLLFLNLRVRIAIRLRRCWYAWVFQNVVAGESQVQQVAPKADMSRPVSLEGLNTIDEVHEALVTANAHRLLLEAAAEQSSRRSEAKLAMLVKAQEEVPNFLTQMSMMNRTRIPQCQLRSPNSIWCDLHYNQESSYVSRLEYLD